MSFEVVWGNNTNPIEVEYLVEALRELKVNGTLYVGYPIIANADSNKTVRALLVSQKPGLIAFDFSSDPETAKEEQDDLFFRIDGSLSKHDSLREGRRLAVSPNVITFTPKHIEDSDGEYYFAYPENLEDVFSKCAEVPKPFYKKLCAAIQRVTTIKPVKKRKNASNPNSRGSILKRIEKEIANLDKWQKRAAIEVPDGPQRIRGLAGSGKTIVLALKAAYLLEEHPEWRIAVTFHSRSLKQQFEDLITRFTFEQSGDTPDWDRLDIYNAWGSLREPGVYSEAAKRARTEPLNYAYAKNKYGRDGAFAGICCELLPFLENHEYYDAVLIDEAQDLPLSFFHLVYKITKKPKRIIWAYDELQNLAGEKVPSVEEMFNTNEVSLNQESNSARRDIILPVCYRNTPWALTVAHALGFGIYRTEGLVQMFEELSLWKDIGYAVVAGQLELGQKVRLQRSKKSTPRYLADLSHDDAVIFESFEYPIDQYHWVANQIAQYVEHEELDPDDILVILPDAYTAMTEFNKFRDILQARDIYCHLAGFNDSNVFARENSVTVSNIYRAKGNEAPVVFLVNADYCANHRSILQGRNSLFTALTRAKAWVRVTGIGTGIGKLIQEYQSVVNNEHALAFKIPTHQEMRTIAMINRDRTPKEEEERKKIKDTTELLKNLIENGSLNDDDPLLKELHQLLKRSD